MDVGDVAIALPAPPISPSALPRLRHVTADELLGDQPVATSFETLQPLLERKHAVIVRGAAGNSIRGMVSAISRDELIVVVLQLQGCDVRMDHLWQAPYRVPHHAQRQSVQMAPVRTRPHHRDDLIAYLREENRILREHLGPRPLRRTDAQRRRLAVRGQKLGRRVWMQVAGIVTPDTILRWYRRLIAQTYDGSARRGRGRPMTRRDVAARVVRMAVENPQWGYIRIRGAHSHLGHEIARTTVKRILHDHGIDPAPERSRRLPWKTVLQAHGEGLTACDRFTVEVLTLAGFQRCLVFFVIALQSRRVTIAGIHPQPYGTWMEQMARNLTDPVDGCLRRARSLMHDRDPLDTRVFGEILEGGGVQPIRLPPKSPNLTADAERFVRSMKEECLSRVVPVRCV